ncbi:L-lactate permease [bacterium]|jgi:lactate permease|nr:L-lactate permease [bacterium]MBT6832316.1 L-lactate permease [bacterium]MBT6996761.1 L-lactate permease [bacterium]MBT7772826.1 L-lactate permease [bacterium]
MNIFLSLLPIAILVFLMARKKSAPAHFALPGAAILMLAIRGFFFENSLNFLAAASVSGFLTALTPILVVWGAVFLFRTIEVSGAMDTIKKWLDSVSKNPVAQVMIVGWAFSFLIEGASGFGTPAALAAPILVGLGFPAWRVVVACLIFNTVPVSFGAAGMPTWFGLGGLGFSPSELLEIGHFSAQIHFVAALVIPFFALSFLVPASKIRKNLGFIFLSILACAVPYLIFSKLGTEFPSLLGGAIGLLISVFIAKKNWGGERSFSKTPSGISWQNLLRATFPLWGVIVILVATRLDFLPFKNFLTAVAPAVHFQNFSISAGGVLSWSQIFGENISWSHAIGYVPSFVPFWIVSILAWWWLGVKKTQRRSVVRDSLRRVRKPAIALFGALILVKLILLGGNSPAQILGDFFANLAGASWPIFAAGLGALGSFFSGSNTVSNLTFGGIQTAVAQSAGISPVKIAALQNVGGAAGNMICLHNIIAACAVLGLENAEGKILRKTILPLVVYLAIAGIFGVLF